ncbi:peptidase M16 [Nitratidesulfovibrio sp. 1201_IL3209]|uniref:peptidase M16 n=1 Tax=Nitratidesulfovibrio sp. 1201_IL3209 TaxID=3084053 RepID=UPI002FDA983C
MQQIIITVLELALRHGVPAILDAVKRCEGEVTAEKIESLAGLVKDPDSYGE